MCQAIKSQEKTRHIPVILLTARSDVEQKLQGLEFGADDYITKPFNPRELLARVAAILRSKEYERELAKALNELKEAEAQLVHSAKLASVGQLAAGLAHEINNPACALDSSLALLGRKLESIASHRSDFDELFPTLRRSVKKAEDSLNRIKKIVDALLNYSRKNREGFNHVNIHEGIESTLFLLESEYQGSITIHKEFGNINQIEADLQQLNQVFMNLLSNAIFAIKARQKEHALCGNIWIQTQQDGDQVQISIQDDGPGIPSDVLPRIFELFFTTKGVGEGTGLGLSISNKIIGLHNGLNPGNQWRKWRCPLCDQIASEQKGG